MYLVVVLYSLFASVFTISKIGLEYTEPFFFVGTRMLAAGVLLLIYQGITAPKSLRLGGKHLGRLFALGLFNIYLTNAMEFWGLKYLTSFKTCFIYSLSPFMAAILSYFLLDERISRRKWLGLAVGCAGFIPILLTHTSSEAAMTYVGIVSLPELAVMVAAAASSYGWILLRQLVKDEGFTPMVANGYSMLIGGIMALVHSYLVEPWHPIPVSEFAPFLKCTLLLIVVSNVLAYNLYGHLLKHFTATFLSFAGFMTPLITAFFGWLVLGETITVFFVASACIVFAGLLIFYQQELRKGIHIDET